MSHPAFVTRLRVVLGLLLGLRLRDLQSARRFMALRYRGRPFFTRLVKFLGWSLTIMWRDIPASLSWVTIDDESVSSTPWWLTAENPLENYPWAGNPRTRLPTEAHTVVVGAGFGGAAVAYHWLRQGTEPLIIIEAKEAASGSAGRNGGIVVMAGGHLHGFYTYERVSRYLAERHSSVSAADQDEIATRFAEAYVKALQTSHEMIAQTIAAEGIDCDYQRRGWLFFTDSVNQHELEESLALAQRCGHGDWVRRSPGEIRQRCGVGTEFDGAESLGSATWHPAKWVWGILGAAVASPHVELYTQTSVTRVERDGDGYAVHTDRGTVWARHVVNATESHTPVVFGNFLDPFPDLITPYKEQGMRAEGGPTTMKPGVGVSGPLGWFARLAAGGFVFGSDDTEVAPRQAGRVEPSRFITRYRSTTVGENWQPAALRVTHEWTGTTSTTPDKYPVIGRLDEHELYIIGGFAGAGSAASFNAGLTIANTILGRPCEPEYHPQEYFSPWRFTDLARYGRCQG